jgi:hypothetical protein
MEDPYLFEKAELMAKTIMEWASRCAALAIAATWVFIYWQRQDNGRYVYPDPTASGYSIVVFDSRTGTVFALDKSGAWFEVHPQTGLTLSHKLVTRPNSN